LTKEEGTFNTTFDPLHLDKMRTRHQVWIYILLTAIVSFLVLYIISSIIAAFTKPPY